jgi:hypothetical protein
MQALYHNTLGDGAAWREMPLQDRKHRQAGAEWVRHRVEIMQASVVGRVSLAMRPQAQAARGGRSCCRELLPNARAAPAAPGKTYKGCG